MQFVGVITRTWQSLFYGCPIRSILCRSRAVQPCGYLAVISLCWLSAKLEFSTVITHARNDLTKPPFYVFPIFRIFHGFVTAFSRCSLVVQCLFYCAANSAFLTASSPLRCIFVGSYTRTWMRAQNSLLWVLHLLQFLRVRSEFNPLFNAFHKIHISRLFIVTNLINIITAKRSTHEAAFFNCWACVSAALKSVGY